MSDFIGFVKIDPYGSHCKLSQAGCVFRLIWPSVILRHSLTIIQNHFIWILGPEVPPNSQVFLLRVPMAVVRKFAFFIGVLTLCLYP